MLVGCGTAERVMHCGQLTYPIDVSIAMSFMLLEAYELGLGTCWMAISMKIRLRRFLPYQSRSGLLP